MKLSPARRAAFDALRAVTTGRRDLPAALADARRSLGDERDRALATEVVTGTLRWLAALDHLIAHSAKRPLDKIDRDILDILRLSVYQLRHLNRVPASAAVDDAVKLTRAAGKGSAAGFVNAVLRNLSRQRKSLPLPPPPDPAPGPRPPAPGLRESTLDYLSITLSHPRWLAERWLDRYGYREAEARERFNNGAAPLTLRTNTLKISARDLETRLGEHGVRVEPARFAAAGLVVTEGNPLLTPLADRGLFSVQDEASQLVAELADARPGERILDACAAPGGKTLAMAAMAHDQGFVVASDFRPRRIDLLRETIRLSGARSIRLAELDLRRPLPFGPVFNCVLVDAPCSGLGTIRRDPDIRWRRQNADLIRFAEAQRAMIRHAAEVVRPGGRLIYATCSSEPEENDDVVAAFVAERADFRAVDPRLLQEVPAGLAAVLDEHGRLRSSPAAHGLEAFFAAVLVRRAT